MLVIPTLARGGSERVASHLSRAWSHSHAVQTVCFDASSPAYATGGRLIDLALPGGGGTCAKALNALRRCVALMRLLRRRRPDLVVAFTETAGLPTVIACLATRSLQRLVVSVRLHPAAATRIEHSVMRVAYRLPHRVVAASRGIRRHLVAVTALPPRRVVFLPNPVDLETLGRVQALPSPPPGPFVLAASRLQEIKRLDTLIAAVASLEREDLHLVILGDGPERERLLAEGRRHGLLDRLHLPGASDTPWAWMAACSCFVLCSRNEGWPNALAEAMALGRPCVATDCPSGPRELIRHPTLGSLVPVGDVTALAQAIRWVLERPSDAHQMGAAAARRMQELALAPTAARWLDLVGHTPRGRRSRTCAE